MKDGSEIHKRVVPILFGRALKNPYHGFAVYTVTAGDSLSSIAQDFYGDPARFRKIFQANRNVLDDPDRSFRAGAAHPPMTNPARRRGSAGAGP